MPTVSAGSWTTTDSPVAASKARSGRVERTGRDVEPQLFGGTRRRRRRRDLRRGRVGAERRRDDQGAQGEQTGRAALARAAEWDEWTTAHDVTDDPS